MVGTNVIETLNFQYDAVGKMTSASDSATSLEFTYTDGLLSREKQTLAPSIIAQSDYIYAGGQVREVSLKLGASATFDSKVSYTYTANGQVATLQQTGPTTDTKSIRYSYDQAGNRVRTERFSDVGYATPIFETLSSYTNAQGQLKPTVQSIKHQRATGTVLASYDFVWDAGNRLSSMTSSADGLTTYSYTPTNQLSAIDYANAPDQSFTYDLNGNRTGSGNVTGADNRLTSNATWDFVYDANGNMTRRTLKSDNSYIEYTYDHRDRLTDVRYRTSAGTLTKRVHFGYDALNRRYLQTVENGSGTILSTVYYVNQGFRKDRGDAGDEIALRLDGTGAVISRYLHGSLVDEVLAEENIGSGGARDVLWAMTDHQGSVRDLARVTAGTASVVNHIVYDAFGKTVSETDAAIAHLYGYTGRELDKETGLQYTRTRYLDLVLARFISQDPKSFAAGDTNLYRYVGNHPSYATDPSGLEEPGSTEELTAEEIEAVNQFLEMSQELQDAMSRMQALDEQQMIHLRANVPHTSRTGSMFANGGVILLVNNKKWLYEYIPQSTTPPPVSSGPFSSAPWVTTPATYRLRETNAIGISDKAIFQRFEFEAGERFYGSVELALSLLPGGATAQEIASGNYGSAAFAFARDVAETALAIGKISKLGKLSKLRSLSDKGRDLTGFASAIMVGIEAAYVGRSGTVAVGSFSEGDSLGGTIALLDGMKSAFGLKFGGKEFVEAALKSKRILAPNSGGKNLFWHGSAEGVENATKNGLFAHGTGNGSKFWATSRGEQGKLTEILIGGNYNIVAKPPFVQYKGGFGSVYKLSAEEASHFNKAWGFQYSWNPYQWYKGVSGQYYFHPGTVSWAQRATELKRGAAITTAIGVTTWGLVELNDWWNGR